MQDDQNEEESLISMSVDTGTKYMARNHRHEDDELQHQIQNEKIENLSVDIPINKLVLNYATEPIQRQTDSARNIKEFVPGQFIPEQHTGRKISEEQSVSTVAWSNPSTVTD